MGINIIGCHCNCPQGSGGPPAYNLLPCKNFVSDAKDQHYSIAQWRKKKVELMNEITIYFLSLFLICKTKPCLKII